MRRFDATLFDMDGTLVDSLDSFVYSAEKALREFGIIHIKRETLRKLIINPFDKIIKTLLPEFSSEHDRIVQRYVQIYNSEGYKLTKPKDRALEVLEQLKRQKVKIAIVTSRILLESSVVPVLQNCKLLDIVDVVVTASQVPRPKPEPFQHELAVKRLGVPKERTIAIGDSPEDIIGAKAAGLKVAAYVNGFHTKQELEVHKPDYFLERLPEILRIVLDKSW